MYGLSPKISIEERGETAWKSTVTTFLRDYLEKLKRLPAGPPLTDAVSVNA